MRECVVVELVSLWGEKKKILGPWYLLSISFRTTSHHEWSTLKTARLPVARLTILDRLVYFKLFSYKDQTLCQHAVWHDFSHTKMRFEGLKLLDFSLFGTSVWEYFVKNHVNFTIKPKLLKVRQIKIEWIVFEVKTPPISYETSSFSTSTLKLLNFTVFFA